MTNAAKRHMNRVAEWGQENGCVVCKQPASELHHILEGRTPGRRSDDWLVIPLCRDCHQGPVGGIHGMRRTWALYKASELEMLARTLEGVYGGK
jgi:hypothetical protein